MQAAARVDFRRELADGFDYLPGAQRASLETYARERRTRGKPFRCGMGFLRVPIVRNSGEAWPASFSA